MGAFDEKHVVVTGGTGALGAAVVRALVAQGASVYVPCRVAQESTGHPLAAVEGVHLKGPVDLSSEEEVAAFYGDLPPLWASIQCAGGFQMAPIAETSVQDFHRMHTMNAVTCFLSCREATSRIRAGGLGGRLVNVGAMPAVHPAAGMTAYGASKAAVVNLTQGLAAELAGEGIYVNAVIPSIMDTPANRAAMPDADHEAWPSVDDVAAQIVDLASPRNRVTRGSLAFVLGQT